jgi:hypothetical protein
MKKETNLTTGVSEPEKVEAYLKELKHPLIDVVKYIRKIILSVDKNIGEGIYWNAPTFYYTGKMKLFNPKEYKRYVAGFVFNKPDIIRIVFLRGAAVDDKSGLLEGDYKDGRRLAVFSSLTDAKSKEEDLKKIIKLLVKGIGQY